MLQPNNGIFILPWYDDQNDTALFTLTPLLEEIVQTRACVPEILDKYRDQIPTWAGFEPDLGGDYEFDEVYDDQAAFDGYDLLPPAPAQQVTQVAQVERPAPQQDYQSLPRNDVPARQTPIAALSAPQYAAQPQPQAQRPQPPQQQPQYEALVLPQAQPYLQQQPQRAGYPQVAPTFSSVSGAYQAQPPQQQQQLLQQPQQAQPPQQQLQQSQQARQPTFMGRPGLGAHQYIPTR